MATKTQIDSFIGASIEALDADTAARGATKRLLAEFIALCWTGGALKSKTKRPDSALEIHGGRPVKQAVSVMAALEIGLNDRDAADGMERQANGAIKNGRFHMAKIKLNRALKGAGYAISGCGNSIAIKPVKQAAAGEDQSKFIKSLVALMNSEVWAALGLRLEGPKASLDLLADKE